MVLQTHLKLQAPAGTERNCSRCNKYKFSWSNRHRKKLHPVLISQVQLHTVRGSGNRAQRQGKRTEDPAIEATISGNAEVQGAGG